MGCFLFITHPRIKLSAIALGYDFIVPLCVGMPPLTLQRLLIQINNARALSDAFQRRALERYMGGYGRHDLSFPRAEL